MLVFASGSPSPKKIIIQTDSALQALSTPKFKTVFFKLQLFYIIQEKPNYNPQNITLFLPDGTVSEWKH
jgi:hypothetical protein